MKAPVLFVAAFAAIIVLAGASAQAAVPGDRIDNFRLLDQNGESHERYYLSDAKAVVVVIQGNGCPIVCDDAARVARHARPVSVTGVEFLLLNVNRQDRRDALIREAAEFGIDFPILADDTQLIGEALGVERTAISYPDTIAPLLGKNCVNCHRAGGVAPWGSGADPLAVRRAMARMDPGQTRYGSATLTTPWRKR